MAPSRLGELYTDAYVRAGSTTLRAADQKETTVIVRFSDKAAPSLLEPEDLIAVAKSEAKQNKHSVLTLLGDPISIAPVIKTLRLKRWYRDWYRQALKAGAKALAAKPPSKELGPDGLPPDSPPPKDVAESWLAGDLHEFVSIRYNSRAAAEEAVTRLLASKLVRNAYVAPDLQFTQAVADPFYSGYSSGMSGIKGQWGPKAMKMDFLWSLTPGHGYVGVVDNGTSENNISELNNADGLSSFRKHQSVNSYAVIAGALGVTGTPTNWQSYVGIVDEYYGNFGSTTPSPATTGIGHGTHVHGVIAARTNNGVGTRGQCANCSVYVGKISGVRNPAFNDPVEISYEALADAIKKLADSGVQVMNLSLGIRGWTDTTCGQLNKDINNVSTLRQIPDQYTNRITVYDGGSAALDSTSGYGISAMCLAVKYAHQLDIAIVAAAGNDKDQDRTELGVAISGLQFPANDARTISVGGAQLGTGNTTSAVAVWDQLATAPALTDSPGRPYYDLAAPSQFRTREVGSNGGAGLWITAPARDIVSTMYEGLNYAGSIRCGTSTTFAIPTPGLVDSQTNPYTAPGLSAAVNPNRRFGVCTGTSMAAPHISGLVGLIRSYKPLMPSISYQIDPVELDVKTFLKNNSRLPGSTVVARNNQMGYGLPDGELIRNALAFTSGAFVNNSNRSTPLLSMINWEDKDYFYTTVPTMAAAAWNGTILGLRGVAMRYCSRGSSFAFYRNPQGYRLLPGLTGSEGIAICSSQSPAQGPNGTILLPPPLGPCGCQTLAAKQNPQFSFYVFTTPVDQNNLTLYPLYRYSSVDPATSTGRHVYLARPAGTPALTGLASGWKFDGYEGYVFPPSATRPVGAGSAVQLYLMVFPATNTYKLVTVDPASSLPSAVTVSQSLGWQLETSIHPGGFMGWVIPSGGF